MSVKVPFRKGQAQIKNHAKWDKRDNIQRENKVKAVADKIHDVIFGAVYEVDEEVYANGKVYRIQGRIEIPGDVVEKPIGYGRFTTPVRSE